MHRADDRPHAPRDTYSDLENHGKRSDLHRKMLSFALAARVLFSKTWIAVKKKAECPSCSSISSCMILPDVGHTPPVWPRAPSAGLLCRQGQLVCSAFSLVAMEIADSAQTFVHATVWPFAASVPLNPRSSPADQPRDQPACSKVPSLECHVTVIVASLTVWQVKTFAGVRWRVTVIAWVESVLTLSIPRVPYTHFSDC